MRKKILIIEDILEQAKVLASIAKEVNKNFLIYYASNEGDAYKILMEKTIDIFLVDIILKADDVADMSGLKLVEAIRKIPRYMFTPVIFITSMEDNQLYAFTELNCIDYIEKPFFRERVIKVLNKAMYYQSDRNEQKVVCLRNDGVIYPLKINEILYAFFTNHKMVIYFEKGKEMTFPYISMNKFMDETEDCFVQCNRHTVINKNKVVFVDRANQCIKLAGVEEPIEIGIRYNKKIAEEYMA